MLPVTPCLIHWKLHPAHNWAYASTDGGHMVRIGSYQEKGYKEWHCLGICHTPKHRGRESHSYRMNLDLTHRPKHRGLYHLEEDRLTLDNYPPFG